MLSPLRHPWSPAPVVGRILSNFRVKKGANEQLCKKKKKKNIKKKKKKKSLPRACDKSYAENIFSPAAKAERRIKFMYKFVFLS